MSIFERGNQYSSRWSHGLKNGLGFYREVLVLSNTFRRRGVALWPLFSTAEWMGRVRHLVFHYIPEWRKFQLWHLRDLNLWTPRWKCTRNPLDRASTSERRMVYSRVEFYWGNFSAEGYLSEDDCVFWHGVFDYEDDDEIPIGCVYYGWYHMGDLTW